MIALGKGKQNLFKIIWHKTHKSIKDKMPNDDDTDTFYDRLSNQKRQMRLSVL